MIRPALAADIPGLLSIWNPVIRDTAITFTTQEKSPDDLAQMLADKAALGQGFLVAEQAGTVLGFATYGQFRGGPGYARAMEHTILLAPQAQGAGLGRALMAAIENEARRGGAHCLLAGISAENPAAVAFHTRIGFAEVAILRQVGWKFGRYMDLQLMQKFLS